MVAANKCMQIKCEMLGRLSFRQAESLWQTGLVLEPYLCVMEIRQVLRCTIVSTAPDKAEAGDRLKHRRQSPTMCTYLWVLTLQEFSTLVLFLCWSAMYLTVFEGNLSWPMIEHGCARMLCSFCFSPCPIYLYRYIDTSKNAEAHAISTTCLSSLVQIRVTHRRFTAGQRFVR